MSIASKTICRMRIQLIFRKTEFGVASGICCALSESFTGSCGEFPDGGSDFNNCFLVRGQEMAILTSIPHGLSYWFLSDDDYYYALRRLWCPSAGHLAAGGEGLPHGPPRVAHPRAQHFASRAFLLALQNCSAVRYLFALETAARGRSRANVWQIPPAGSPSRIAYEFTTHM
jgi:hypothetical protein